MSTILSNGFVKPEDGDKGDVVFTALEDNIQQVNDHDHDGVNSEQLTSTSIKRTTVEVDDTGWTPDPGSTSLFYKNVILPTPFDFTNDDFVPSVRFYIDDGTYILDDEVFPKWSKATPTVLRMFSPTSSQAYKVVFV